MFYLPASYRLASRHAVACCDRSVRNQFSVSAALLVVFAVACRLHAQPPTLPNDEQIIVKRAIQDGQRYLMARQAAQNDGGFPGPGHPVGVTALAGLALLESGLEAQDRSMKGAAQYIRQHALDLSDTYDLSLAVLFLDRLGNKSDRGLIQTFALRLIGGQTTTGGWTYKCPIFTKPDHSRLLTILHQLDELEKPMRAEGAGGAGGKQKTPALGAGEKPTGGGSSPSTGPIAAAALAPRPGMCIKMADSAAQPVSDGAKQPAGTQPVTAKPPEQKAGGKVPITGNLALLPVLQELDKLGEHAPNGSPDAPVVDPKAKTDNSNTQFAILAIWAAQRHNVPVRRTLYLVTKRFRESQNPDGGWGYNYSKPGTGDSTAAMTCAGLTALAIGVGLAEQKEANKQDEARIQRAFRCLMKFIGEPSETFQKRVAFDNDNSIYYLWSMERVARLFDLPTLGNRDWYRWGAEILVTNQSQSGQHAGAWLIGGDPRFDDRTGRTNFAVVNTSLALLFLKGANLVSDLALPVNPEELNKELAGGGVKAAVRTGKPGDKDPIKGLLGGDTESDAPAVPPMPEQPKTSEKTDHAPPVAQTQPSAPSAPTPAEKKSDGDSNTMMIVIFSVVAVIVVGGVGAAIFLVTRQGKKSDEEESRGPQRRRPAARNEDEEEEAKPRPRRVPPRTRAGGKRPSRARYDDDEDED